jgi:hypothetical protein
MTMESAKEALQAALADSLLVTVCELDEKKDPGWACSVHAKESQLSLSTLRSRADDGDVMSQGDHNQPAVGRRAGLLKKPKQSSHAHGVSKDNWETFCANSNIKCCEEKAMSSSTIAAWEGRRCAVFFKWGSLTASIQRSGQHKSWKVRQSCQSFCPHDSWMQG